MKKHFLAELWSVLVLLAAGLAIGWNFGFPLWGLLLAGMIYGFWALWQLYQISRWLTDSIDSDIPSPSTYGVWQGIVERIELAQRNNVAEQDKLKEVLQRSRKAATALVDGIVIMTTDGEIEWFNASAVDMLGLQPEDKGESIVNLIRQPKFYQYMEEQKEGEVISLPSPQGDGRQFSYQVTQYDKRELLLVVRDITRVYKLEKMRKDFVANVSHELKTPLTVIRGYVEMMADSPDAPPQWGRLLDQMNRQVGRMTSLISDLISLTKLETDNPDQNWQEVAIQPLLERAVSDARAVSEHSEFTIDCPDTFSLLGNEGELFSAFSNLVVNAVKYAGESPEVYISAEVDDEGAAITFADNGQGIDPIHLPRLTERFYRVDKGRDSSSGGTGLGLAIVKHVLIRHNATLDIQSKIGRGSSFCCSFPIQRVREERPAA